MQRSTVAPGLPPVTALNIAVLPPSLSATLTLPAVNWLPVFDVVLENAENTPNPARLPATPMTRSVSRIFWNLLIVLVPPRPGLEWPGTTAEGMCVVVDGYAPALEAPPEWGTKAQAGLAPL